MSGSAHSLGTPPATDTPTPTAVDEQPAPPIDTNKSVVDPVNHATRDPKFGPGVGQAFFSTELGARAPRSLGPIRMPVIAHSVQDPAVLVQAATYWQIKYKSQCLCILPSQGWTVEDLWDAEDLHVEGRKFCKEMLTFISRNTYYTADRFARDWARAHPDRVDFTGLEMGNVYDITDPLDIIDQIFIFGEPIDFPRVFLWHVAHILITTWIETEKATNAVLRMSLTPQAHSGGQKTANGAAEPSFTPSDASDENKSKSSSAVDKPDRTTIVASEVPDQPSTRHVSQRIPSQGLVQPGGHFGLLRGGDAGVIVGPSRASPNMQVLPLNAPKANRNIGSGSYGQQQGWAENSNRTLYGVYPRQPSGTMLSMQSPHFLPPQMAMGQHVPQPMMTALSPYVQMAHPGYGFQQPDPGMIPRAHINYQQGMMQTQPLSPVFPHQPNGQHVSMGDMSNNKHHANNMMFQHQDPRAPLPRRPNQRNAQDLYDPYGGNNPKFNGAPGYNNGSRKGGNNGFAPQSGRGRKVSNTGGREAYNRSNADFNANVPSSGPRYSDSNARCRLSEDDPTITGDSVSGCGHTWIGPKNSTVNELWIGDLPPDAGQDELIQLFKQTVGVAPIAIALRNKFPQPSTHAFATFASPTDAKAALGITKFHPQLRGGCLIVTVPRRFYQKDPPSVPGYFDQTHSGQATDHMNRDVTRMSTQQEEKAVGDPDPDPATANSTALYSPQDARSGLSKKPPTQSEVAGHPETEKTEFDMPKRQQKSPTKKNKNKGKRESPIKKTKATEETTNTSRKPNADGPAVTKVNQIDTHSTKAVTEPTKPASVDAVTLSQEHVAATTNTTLAVDRSANAVCNLAEQPPEDSKAPDVMRDDEKPPTEPSFDVSPAFTGVQSKVRVTTSDTIPVAEGGKSMSAKSSNTASNGSSTPEADDSVTDDETKNDTSFHSAPEVQPESVQVEPQSKIEDKAMATKQDISESPPTAIETSLDEPQTLSIQRSSTQSEQPASALPKEATTPQVSELDSTQEPAASTTSDTAPTSALDSAAISTVAEVSPTDTTKKAGAQQMQSLHPFAKNKSQAKKEREAKKKQQKKEDADRIAKAKAEKVASLKKPKESLIVQPKTESIADDVNSSTATDAVAKQEATRPHPNGDTTTENKKSKGKAKAPIVGASSANRGNQVKTEGETGKLDGAIKNSKEIPSVTHKAEASSAEPVKQESLDRSGAACVTEPTPSRAPPVPPITPKSQAPVPKKPAQEVNDPHNLTSKQSTHTPGSQTSQIDSNLSHTLLSSTANDPIPSEHDKAPSERMSRSSSSSTLIGDEDRKSLVAHPILALNPPDPSQPTTVSAEAPQPDAAPIAAPKKKKKKTKKKKTKKNKKTAATATDPAQSIVSGDAPGSTSTDEDYHAYDPFASQLNHIDAIRRAVKHDTASYFARTNTRIEKEAEERKEAGQSPKADIEMGEQAAQIEAS